MTELTEYIERDWRHGHNWPNVAGLGALNALLQLCRGSLSRYVKMSKNVKMGRLALKILEDPGELDKECVRNTSIEYVF